MALEDLDAEGVKLNVHIIDTEASEQKVTRDYRTNTDLRNSHLVIGPYRRDNVRLAGDYAKQVDHVLVSPYSASSGLATRNPGFVQVSPTLETHCEAITRHARARFRPDQIVLVCRDKEAEIQRLQYFQDENARLTGFREAPRFREYVVAEEGENFDALDLTPLLEVSDTTVFIIPSWSSETFIYSFLRKIDLARSEFNHIVVYGMPQWMEYEIIDYDYYEKLNVHVSSNIYLDQLSSDVKFFKRRFYERYGVAPPDEAFIGYDVMYYFGRMLHKNGTRFQYVLERQPAEALHTLFDFERVVIPTTTGRENPPIEYFENKFVNILRFQDYQFRPATN